MATKTKKSATTKAKQTKATKPAKAKAVAKGDGKMSQIEAALKVLAEARKPMNCKAMVEAMGARGYPMPRDSVVDGLIRRGDVCNIIGGPKARKLFLVLQPAISVAAGLPFLGMVTQRGKGAAVR
jgi:hypothetical protein